MRKNLPFYSINVIEALKNFARVGALCFVLIFSGKDSFGQATLIADINDDENEQFNEFSNLRDGNGKVYYVSEGKYLYVHYTNSEGHEVSQKLASFVSINNLLVIGNILFFVADDGVTGVELWKSDGREGGTAMVKNIFSGSSSSAPEQLTNVNGVLYFVANNGTSGKEIFKSDGTSGGTMLVKDVFPKGGSSNPRHLTNVNGTLFFAASDGTTGYELWKSNGTATGTSLVRDIKTGLKVSSSPEALVNVNGVLFFTASESATGRELYKSNGTEAGTVLVKDIRSGTSGANIENMTGVNSILFFTANDGIFGHELWKSDGTAIGTVLVKDMTPGGAGSHGETSFSHRMANFTNINGLLFYTAYQNHIYYIWKSNGTAAGTIPLIRAKGPGIGQPRPLFTVMDGHIFFFNTADDWDETVYSLFRMNLDGSGVTHVYQMMNTTYDYYYSEMVVAKDPGNVNHLYFTGTPIWTGFKLIKSDGTEEGTEPLYDHDPYIGTDGSNPHSFQHWNGKVAFIAQATFYESESVMITDGTNVHEAFNFQHMSRDMEVTSTHIYGSGRDWLELYRTDGSGAYQYEEIANEYELSPARNLTYANGHVYYTNFENQLWKIDGTTNALSIMRTFNSLSSLTALGSYLIFRVRTPTNGEELWRTNGTTSGTLRYSTVRTSAAQAPFVSPSITIKNTHYFVANNGVNGNEIWRTQGSGASTYMLTDLNANDAASVTNNVEYDISTFGSFRDSLYFSAIGSDGMWGLYKTNGTAAGVRKVINMNAVKSMVSAGGKLYLFVYGADNRNGLNLWVTNGTASGTKLLKELTSSTTINTYFMNGVLYFNLNYYGGLWRTDGTACGTVPVETGTESTPLGLIGLNNILIFSGYEAKVGYEPFRLSPSDIPTPACDDLMVADQSNLNAATNAETMFTMYPNPFTSDFELSLADKRDEAVTIRVTTSTGFPVENYEGISNDKLRFIGQSWPTGMYIVRVTRGEKTETRIVVKK